MDLDPPTWQRQRPAPRATALERSRAGGHPRRSGCRHGPGERRHRARHRPAHPLQFRSSPLDITHPADWGRDGVEAKLASLCAEAVDSTKGGSNLLIVTERALLAYSGAIPAL